VQCNGRTTCAGKISQCAQQQYNNVHSKNATMCTVTVGQREKQLTMCKAKLSQCAQEQCHIVQVNAHSDGK